MGAHKRFGGGDDGESEELVVQQPIKLRQESGRAGPISKWTKKNTQSVVKKRKTKSVRSRMRDIERLLKKKGSEMTPAGRKAKGAELEELSRLRDDHDRVEREKAMARKYRMVKFFERRKLERALETIVKRGDKEDDTEEKQQVLRNLRYIAEYPKDRKYIALFPSQGHTDESKARVEAMRKEIEQKSQVGSEHGLGEATKEHVSQIKDQTEHDDFFLEESD